MEETHAVNRAQEAEDLDQDNHVGGAPEAVSGVPVDYPERSLVDAADAAARAGEPLKIRTALQVYNPELKPYGHFRGWRGQAWTVAVKGIEEAKKLQQVIEITFDLVRIVGVDHLHLTLRDIKSRYRSDL